MKSQIFFIATALAAATAALGFATVGPLRAPNPPITAPVHVSNSTGAAPHVYCYNGLKSDRDSLYRGWICEPTHEPTLRR